MSSNLIKGGDKLVGNDSALAVAQKRKGFITYHDDLKTTSRSVLCLDVSYSMNHRDGKDRYDTGGKRRIDHLRDAVEQFPEMRRVSFSTKVYPDTVPEPQSSTQMNAGLDWIHDNLAGEYESVILVSDGDPDSEEDAMRSAQSLGVPVNTIFIGQAGSRGEAFLKKVADATGGKQATTDPNSIKQLGTGLAGAIRGFLPESSGPDASGDGKKEAICL